MCTLSFLPGQPGGGYVLATNRDERPGRGPAVEPFLRQHGERLLLAPRDSDCGGTWIGVDDLGRCIAVLNGDRPPAAQAPADAVSRGLLVLELLDDPAFDAVRATLDERSRLGRLAVKPFKLVVAAPGDGHRPAHVLHADWDGAELEWEHLDGPQCVVSSTYRSGDVAARRLAAFGELLAGAPRADADALVDATAAFQASHVGDDARGDAYGVCMHRPDARTVSATLVCVTADEVAMHYQAGWPCRDGPVSVTTMPRARAQAGA